MVIYDSFSRIEDKIALKKYNFFIRSIVIVNAIIFVSQELSH